MMNPSAYLMAHHTTVFVTFLMLFDTINFASDTAQLFNVVSSYTPYNVWPLNRNGLQDTRLYTPIWDVATSKTGLPILGFSFFPIIIGRAGRTAIFTIMIQKKTYVKQVILIYIILVVMTIVIIISTRLNLTRQRLWALLQE